VDASRRPETADPEFDPLPGHRPRLIDFDPPDHQRLVVNPFLAVLGLIGLGWMAYGLIFDSPAPALAIVMIFPIALLPYLIQYHCLDCGRTAAYPRHKRHACAGVVARWREGYRRRFPFPSPWAQLVVWGWLLGAIALLLGIVTWT
jgi:hypothetical protein